MKRFITDQLCAWKVRAGRKPLILRGVRQCGKTYALKHVGEHQFRDYHYFNFEKNGELSNIFEGNLDPKRIVKELSFYIDKDINILEDLIIFDEIQACPNALTSLKYFCEDLPQAYVCCAGSLLGLHLSPGSFPVGKVEIMNLRPMCFAEFLLASGQQKLFDFFHNYSFGDDIPTIVHQRLWDQLKYYFIVGGLPEVVLNYTKHVEDIYTACKTARKKQEELIVAYQSDIAKHAGKVNAMHIDRIWRSVPTQLATAQTGSSNRFKFKGVIPAIDRYSRMSDAIDWLCAAELVIKVPIANQARLPFSAYTKENRFKLYMLDVGMLGALSGLPPKTILDYDYGSYKGYFAENFVAQAFVASSHEQLFAWEERRAEIEFLHEKDGKVIPIEVKSGWATKAKSLRSFCDKYQPAYSVIFSAQEINANRSSKIRRYPLYLAGHFPNSQL